MVIDCPSIHVALLLLFFLLKHALFLYYTNSRSLMYMTCSSTRNTLWFLFDQGIPEKYNGTVFSSFLYGSNGRFLCMWKTSLHIEQWSANLTLILKIMNLFSFFLQTEDKSFGTLLVNIHFLKISLQFSMCSGEAALKVKKKKLFFFTFTHYHLEHILVFVAKYFNLFIYYYLYLLHCA